MYCQVTTLQQTAKLWIYFKYVGEDLSEKMNLFSKILPADSSKAPHLYSSLQSGKGIKDEEKQNVLSSAWGYIKRESEIGLQFNLYNLKQHFMKT